MNELIELFLDTKTSTDLLLYINFRNNSIYFVEVKNIMNKIYNVIVYYPSHIHCMQTPVKINLHSFNYKQYSNLFEKDLNDNLEFKNEILLSLEKALLL